MIFDVHFAAAILPQLLQAAVLSVAATIVAFGLALALGGPIMLARRSSWWWLARASAGITDFIRCTPLLIQLFFLYFALPSFGVELPPLVIGVLVFGVHFGCYMSEVYRAGLESVPPGQWDACHALGFSRWATYRLVILPLALRPVIPPAGNYLVHMFKETPLLASISVTEMMFVASDIGAERFRYLEPITLCGLLFLMMSLTSAALIRFTERQLRIAGRSGDAQ